jgi:ABC-type transporter Mla subunit MlaD
LRDSLRQVRSLVDRAEPDLLDTVARLNEVTTNAAALTERLEHWFGNEDGLDTLIDDGFSELPALVTDSRRTLRELDKLVINLREDPSQILHRPKTNAVPVEP